MKKATIVNHSFQLVQQSTLEILRISALPHLPEPENATEDNRLAYRISPRYVRPKKPEEVQITLFTEDGQKWQAKWEKVSP